MSSKTNKDLIEKKKAFHKEYIKTPEFEEVKKAVFERDGHKCVCCRRTENLVCHHTGYKHLGRHDQSEIDDCVTLCVHCHAMGIHKNPANIHWFSVEHPRNCDDLREVDGILVRSNGEDFFDAKTFKRLKPFKSKSRSDRKILNIPGGDGKQEYVYELVAKAFPEVCGKVHHLDRDTENDKAENPMTAELAMSKERTAQYTLSGNLIAVYPSSIVDTTGASLSYIWKSFEDNEDIPEFIPPVKSLSERKSEIASKPVLQYDKKGNLIREWKSATEASSAFGFKSVSSITNCLIGRNKTSGGYIWKYKEAK